MPQANHPQVELPSISVRIFPGKVNRMVGIEPVQHHPNNADTSRWPLRLGIGRSLNGESWDRFLVLADLFGLQQ
jgi:hypothetical protein